MELNQAWHKSIFQRVSTRKFNGQPVSEEHLKHLEKFAAGINSTTRGFRIAIIQEKSEEIFKGIIGSYGQITGSTVYAAFIGRKSFENMESKVGYYGEAFILEATTLGVATCWVGGTFSKSKVVQHVILDTDEKIFCITPLGYSSDLLTQSEKMLKMLVGSDRRKTMDKICRSCVSEETPDWFLSGVESARLAPSAMNRQPWQFRMMNGKAVVSSKDKGVFSRLDCGIAMLHFELGVSKKDVSGRWIYLSAPDVGGFIPYESNELS